MVSVVRGFTGYSLREWWFDWCFKPKSSVGADVLLKVLAHPNPEVRRKGLSRFDWSELPIVLNSDSISLDGLCDIFDKSYWWPSEVVDKVNWDKVFSRLDFLVSQPFDRNCATIYDDVFPVYDAMKIISSINDGRFVLPESFLMDIHYMLQDKGNPLYHYDNDDPFGGIVSVFATNRKNTTLDFYVNLLSYISLSEECKSEVWLTCREGLLSNIIFSCNKKRGNGFYNEIRRLNSFPLVMLVDMLSNDVSGFIWGKIYGSIKTEENLDVGKWRKVLIILLEKAGFEDNLDELPLEWLVELYNSLTVKELVL